VLTTLDSALNRLDQPMVLGYSSAGMIRAIGPGLQGFQVGERVACAGGGYAVHAEYAAVPQNLLAHLPSNVEFEQAAFVTLGAIALHGPHQGAQKSTNTGLTDCNTSDSKLLSPISRISFAIKLFPFCIIFKSSTVG